MHMCLCVFPRPTYAQLLTSISRIIILYTTNVLLCTEVFLAMCIHHLSH